MGDAKGILTMFVRKKKHRSGNIGVIVAEKICGKMKELVTIGVAYNEGEVDNLVNEANPKRNHAVIRSLTFSARNVRRVTVSVMKSVVYCPM